MTKKLIFLIILIVLLLPSQYYMVTGYKSLDGKIHSARIDQFHQAVKLKQIPVRIAPSLIGDIGYPLFIVNYQLPYYMAEVFMSFSNNSEFAYKSVMSASFVLSGIFAFLYFREIGSYWAALTGAVVFSYLPYRFGDLYARGSFGESVSIMFIPLIFLGIHKVLKNKSYGIILLSLSLFGLITSHTVVFLIFIPLIILYSLFLTRHNWSKLYGIILSFGLGMLMTSFQLLPSIFEKKFLTFDANLAGTYKNLYISFYELFRIPGEGINIGSFFQVGIAGTLILLLGSLSLIIKRNKLVILYLLFGFFSIYLINSSSELLWRTIPGMDYVIYPYRFLILTLFSISAISVFLVDIFNKKSTIAILLIGLTMFVGRHFYYSLPPTYEIKLTPTLTTQSESNTIWTNESTFIDRPLLSAIPKIDTSNLIDKPFLIKFNTTTIQTTNVIIRKMYVPGWQLKINDREYPIIIKDGLISFNLETGKNQVDVRFTESPLRKIANIITILSFGLILFIYIKKPKYLENK